MKTIFLAAILSLLSIIASAQTYYNSSYTGAEVDAALLKTRDSMLVAADTTTKVAMQWELNGKLDDADSTAIRTFSNSRYAYKNFMDASDGNPDSALYIDPTGQVGIGTTSPTAPLHVVGNIKATTYFEVGNYVLSATQSSGLYYNTTTQGKIHVGTVTSGNAYPWLYESGDGASYTGGYHAFHIDGTEIMKITGSNISIGAITPYHKLSAASSNATNVNAFNFVDTDINVNITTAATSRDTSSINGWFSGSGSPTFTVIGKAGETLFKVDSSGVYGVKDTLTQSFGIMDTVTVGIIPGWKVPFDLTVISVSAYTDANTVNFNIEERSAATPNTATDSIFVSSLVADNNAQDSTSFTGSAGASFAKDTWMTPRVHSCGDVAIFSISVRYVKNY